LQFVGFLVENTPVIVHAARKSENSASLTFSYAVTEETVRSFVEFDGFDFKLEKVNTSGVAFLAPILGLRVWRSFAQILHGSSMDFDFIDKQLGRLGFAI
jgi:hypothetical protein